MPTDGKLRSCHGMLQTDTLVRSLHKGDDILSRGGPPAEEIAWVHVLQELELQIWRMHVSDPQTGTPARLPMDEVRLGIAIMDPTAPPELPAEESLWIVSRIGGSAADNEVAMAIACACSDWTALRQSDAPPHRCIAPIPDRRPAEPIVFNDLIAGIAGGNTIGDSSDNDDKLGMQVLLELHRALRPYLRTFGQREPEVQPQPAHYDLVQEIFG